MLSRLVGLVRDPQSDDAQSLEWSDEIAWDLDGDPQDWIGFNVDEGGEELGINVEIEGATEPYDDEDDEDDGAGAGRTVDDDFSTIPEVSDKTELKRRSFFPGLSWLLPRKLYEEPDVAP